MSKKLRAAIEAQQYTSKLISGTCGNCLHVVPVMGERLMYLNPHQTMEGTEIRSVEVGQKCGIGGFSVKKLGSCAEHAFGKPDTSEPLT